MDMLLSVAQGSVNSPRVAVLQWKGRKDAKEFDLGLVGKGVTFDSGGISLKPAANMGDMKGDMTGSAVVVAAIKAAALQKLPVNVVGVVGLVENMPSGSATRPGDIVRSMSGQTVEIVNTDAEGRLVLGDCLWYIQEKFGVKKIINVATLTGSTMMTFGFEYAGLFANDDKLAAELTACGETSGEKLWRLPINAEYDKLMDSDIADMKNTGPRLAGGITAACFLQRFIKEGVKWAHLDIAGVDKDENGRQRNNKRRFPPGKSLRTTSGGFAFQTTGTARGRTTPGAAFSPPAENGRHGFFEPLAQNGSRKLLPDTNYIFSRSLPFPLGKYGFFRASSAATCKNFFAPSESSTPLFSRSFLIS